MLFLTWSVCCFLCKLRPEIMHFLSDCQGESFIFEYKIEFSFRYFFSSLFFCFAGGNITDLCETHNKCKICCCCGGDDSYCGFRCYDTVLYLVVGYQNFGGMYFIWGYCKLKEEALDRTLWRTRFGRGYGPVVGQTTWMNEYLISYI
jgi:hypothetical protein